MNLRNYVRMHRARLDMTQEELAQAVGVSRQTIHAIERGKAEPGIVLALRLARLFELKVEELFVITNG
jgi:putative transcriptional regulator